MKYVCSRYMKLCDIQVLFLGHYRLFEKISFHFQLNFYQIAVLRYYIEINRMLSISTPNLKRNFLIFNNIFSQNQIFFFEPSWSRCFNKEKMHNEYFQNCLFKQLFWLKIGSFFILHFKEIEKWILQKYYSHCSGRKKWKIYFLRSSQ